MQNTIIPSHSHSHRDKKSCYLSLFVPFKIPSDCAHQTRLRHIKYCNQVYSMKDLHILKSTRSIKHFRNLKLSENEEEEDDTASAKTEELLKLLKPYRQYLKGLETVQPSILIYFPRLTSYKISSYQPDLIESFTSRMSIGDLISSQEEPQSLFRSNNFLSTINAGEAESLHIQPYQLSLNTLFSGVHFETCTLNFCAIPLSELREETFDRLATTILQKLTALKSLKHLQVEFEEKSLPFFYAFLSILNRYPDLLESLQTFKISPQKEEYLLDNVPSELVVPLETLKNITRLEMNGFDIFIRENASHLLNLCRMNLNLKERIDDLTNVNLFSNLKTLNIDVHLDCLESKRKFLTSWSLPSTIEVVKIDMIWTTNQVEGEEVEVFEEELELYPGCQLFEGFSAKWEKLPVLKHLSISIKKFYKLQSINESFILPILSKLPGLEVVNYNFKNIAERGFNLPQSSKSTVIAFQDLVDSLSLSRKSLERVRMVIKDAIIKDFNLGILPLAGNFEIQARVGVEYKKIVSRFFPISTSEDAYYEIKSVEVPIQSLEAWKEFLHSLSLLPKQVFIHFKIHVRDVPLRSFMMDLLVFIKGLEEKKRFITFDIHSDYNSPLFLDLGERIIKISQKGDEDVETLKIKGINCNNNIEEDYKIKYANLFNVKKFLMS